MYHPLPDGGVTLLGAVEGVTPTMTLASMDGARILIDCGVGHLRAPLDEAALDAETLILTHAHNDHLSGLAKLLAEGRVKRIYATAPTLDIAVLQVKDSIRLSGGTDRDYRDFRLRFDEIARPLRYGAWQKRGHETAKVSFALFESGHILGSASVELRSEKSRVIVSGDLGRPNSPIQRDYHTAWNDDRSVDLVLLETTYGDRAQPLAARDLTDKLEKAILHALKDGGHILVPAFAIGRTQVLLYLLNELVEAGRLPELPVAVDTPMGLRVTDTYKRFR